MQDSRGPDHVIDTSLAEAPPSWSHPWSLQGLLPVSGWSTVPSSGLALAGEGDCMWGKSIAEKTDGGMAPSLLNRLNREALGKYKEGFLL